MRFRYCIVLGVLMFVLTGRDLQANTRIFWMAAGSGASDFDGNGRVDFTDFLIFLKGFNTHSGEAVYNPRLDLDGDGAVNFNDFLAFSAAYGSLTQTAPPPSGSYLIYVADSEDGSVVTLDATSHIMYDYLPFRRPGSVVISPDQQAIYVDDDFGFFKLDTQLQVQFVLPVESRGRIALTPDGTRAYVPDLNANLVRVIDVINGVTLDSVAVGRAPTDVGMTPDGRKLYVPNRTDKNVSVIDVGSLQVIGQIVIGAIPDEIVVSPDGKRGYVTNLDRGVISVLDLNTDQVVGAVQLDQDGASGAELSPDGSVLYVSANGTLVAIDIAHNLILRTLHVADDTSVLGITPDGLRAYIGSFDQLAGGSGINVVDLKNWQVMGRLRGFYFPSQIAFRKLPTSPSAQ